MSEFDGRLKGQFADGESANLDALRSVAVLLVFGTHYADISCGLGATGSFLWHLGQLGVLLFFVHTALVLMWSLDRSSLRGGHLFGQFYLRRAFRIYPLSIVCVLFAWCFDARWIRANLWQNLTLTQYLVFRGSPSFPPTVTPLWSLPLELEMYLLLPVLYLVFRQRSVRVLAELWCVAAGINYLHPNPGPEFTILRYVPCFLGGVIAWRLMRDREWEWRLPGWTWPIGIAAVSLIWLFSGQAHGSLFVAVFGGCLGVAIPAFQEIRWRRINTISKTVARYSYGIYLTHFPIMVWVLSAPSPGHPHFRMIPAFPIIRHGARPIEAFLVVALTAAASFVLYHAIEAPGIRLGRNLARRLAPDPGAPPVHVAAET